MRSQPLVFLGASTSFAEIVPIIDDLNRAGDVFEIVAILDDDPATHGKKLGDVRVAGPLEAIVDYPEAKVVFGIGSHRTRLQRLPILRRLDLPEERYQTLVHPAARIYPAVTIGAGAIVHPGVTVAGEATIEPFSVVTFNAIIGPRATIGWGALIASAAVILSDAEIGPCAFIGACSAVAENVKIGAGAMVGLGTILSRNVAPGAFVLGNPPRTLLRTPVPQELTEPGKIRIQEALV